MTFLRPCVRYSVRLSFCLSGRPFKRSCLRKFFHRIHLKVCRLSAYDMKMCIWFWNFDSSFHRMHWKFPPVIQRCGACGFRIFLWYGQDTVRRAILYGDRSCSRLTSKHIEPSFQYLFYRNETIIVCGFDQ